MRMKKDKITALLVCKRKADCLHQKEVHQQWKRQNRQLLQRDIKLGGHPNWHLSFAVWTSSGPPSGRSFPRSHCDLQTWRVTDDGFHKTIIFSNMTRHGRGVYGWKLAYQMHVDYHFETRISSQALMQIRQVTLFNSLWLLYRWSRRIHNAISCRFFSTCFWCSECFARVTRRLF